jgi:hypothetical protein
LETRRDLEFVVVGRAAAAKRLDNFFFVFGDDSARPSVG